ncbi:MAG: hypothetical protein IH899_21090 [Planctomycetes bacterium]|nr:hypothetical protein [Planctomycetota bacterium]
MAVRYRVGLILLLLMIFLRPCRSAPSPLEAGELHSQKLVRQPVALVTFDHLLYAANRRSGTVSIIDLERRTVINEIKIGKSLSDLKMTSGGQLLLAVDEQQHQLILLKRDGRSVIVLKRLPVAYSPVSVCVSAEDDICWVASLWSKRITLVKILKSDRDQTLKILKEIDLPFAPREQLLIRNGKQLVVAYSHGGRLAVIDTQTKELRSVVTFSGHNIRGLAADRDGRELLVTHQLLNEYSSTSRNHVFWGGLISNMLRSISFEEFSATKETQSQHQYPKERRLAHWSFYPFGRPGSATGDPAKILLTKNGQTIVTLSGVNEIAVRTAPTQPFVRRDVGTRPTAVTTDADEKFAYVANTFDDTVSILQMSDLKIVETLSLGPRPALTPAERGELLFYNARSSLDGWYSCHSCHTDGHTNGLLNDNLSDGSFGDSKRILSLLGTGRTGPWAWNGSRKKLSTQIQASMKSTMQGNPEMINKENIQALEAYLLTLKPAPSISKARGMTESAAVLRGKKVFQHQGCVECHRPPRYTSSETYDVGLEENSGTNEYNPPSLLGVSQRAPFFHDNRASSLKDVLTRFQHGESEDLSTPQIKDLLAFLRSL